MSQTAELVLTALRERLDVDRPYLVACSGGRDSMALVAALRELGQRGLHVATVDHGLRPTSGSDAEFVCATMGEWGLPVTLLRADPARIAHGRGLEDGARRERYRCLRTLASSLQADVLTAHTADDQAETLLLRLNEGTGLRGARGILDGAPGLVRPWLGVTRAEVSRYASDRGVPFREDPSNADPRHRRNALRQLVTPGLSTMYGRSWALNFARSVGHSVDACDALDALLNRVAPGLLHRHEEGSVRLCLTPLEGLPDSVWRWALLLALDALESGTPAADGAKRLSRRSLMPRLMDLAQGAPNRQMAGQGGGPMAFRGRTSMFLDAPPAGQGVVEDPRGDPVVVYGPGTFIIGTERVAVGPIAPLAHEPLGRLDLRLDQHPLPWVLKTPGDLSIDARQRRQWESLVGPLELPPWRRATLPQLAIGPTFKLRATAEPQLSGPSLQICYLGRA
ncbi:MAG: tRNA lysidine(34) synthetase TilS [Myxococcales bacterium]|nr:tRNA lysidine(34) synthetase TilS [Myxococcales bacterium]